MGIDVVVAQGSTGDGVLAGDGLGEDSAVADVVATAVGMGTVGVVVATGDAVAGATVVVVGGEALVLLGARAVGVLPVAAFVVGGR